MGGVGEMLGTGEARPGRMRSSILVVVVLSACATRGEQRSSPAAERASTAAVEALLRGDYDAALRRTERALVEDPDDPWLLYNRGLALAGLDRLDDALDALRAAESRFDDKWGRSLAIYRRALALEFAGRCEESSTELSRYAALVPEAAEQALAHVQFCLGGTREQTAERDEAARLIADLASRRAEEASTAVVRALVLADYPLALKLAEEGLVLAPDDPWLLYNKGAALAGLERTDEALATLRAAERRFDAHSLRGRSVAIYRRALALEAVGRCQEEAQELEKFSALVADAQVARHAQAHLKFCRLVNARQTF